MADLKLDLTASLPGEQLLIKILDSYDKARANMSDKNRDGWDALWLAMARGFHNSWVELGWPGERV